MIENKSESTFTTDSKLHHLFYLFSTNKRKRKTFDLQFEHYSINYKIVKLNFLMKTKLD